MTTRKKKFIEVEIQINYSLQNTVDITNYFSHLKGRALNSTTPGASHVSILNAAREVNNLGEREMVKEKMRVLPDKIKKAVAHFVC